VAVVSVLHAVTWDGRVECGWQVGSHAFSPLPGHHPAKARPAPGLQPTFDERVKNRRQIPCPSLDAGFDAYDRHPRPHVDALATVPGGTGRGPADVRD
jgi:hypothetical protein